MPSEMVSGRARPRAWFAMAVAIVSLCWIVGNPRSSGPDEPSHMVASAALVRGEVSGRPNPIDPATRLMRVPAMVGEPNPACWAFVPSETPACTASWSPSTEMVEAPTTSHNYPPFGLFLPGLASFVPWAGGYAYLARVLSASLAVVLVSATLAMLVARGRLPAAAALLGTTPIAWFTFGVVNPSATAIAGGLALAAGSLMLATDRGAHAHVLATAGWLAVLLPRRDGPLWAAAIVIVVCMASGVRPTELWRALPRWSRLTVAISAPLPVLQVLVRGDTGFNVALAVAVLLVPVYEVLIALWCRCREPAQRAAFVATAALLGVLGFGAVLVVRPGGYDAALLGLVVGNTGDHLVQLVGVLGWLNAPVPMSGVVLFWVAFGGLLAVAAIERPRSAVAAIAGLAGGIVLAWVLELGQGASYGNYWQGRYTMPLVVALPLVAAWRTERARVDQLTVPLVAIWWIVLNLGFFAAQRRWAVGVDGTWYVWRWDTWGSPFPPVLVLVVHAAATAWLAWIVATSHEVGRS